MPVAFLKATPNLVASLLRCFATAQLLTHFVGYVCMITVAKQPIMDGLMAAPAAFGLHGTVGSINNIVDLDEMSTLVAGLLVSTWPLRPLVHQLR